ncbi:hypothetical protein V5O48_017066 [Marasmius crinis-equi]|uniref:DEAD/DEAH box helicase domain-containing protein n=1 Tax=Marasmius crinis-equi TaxID=585013 RepID=A0ABR3EQ16_9AGAR
MGVIPTGGGKSMAFLSATVLYPDRLFVVISPLNALTNDLARRLMDRGMIKQSDYIDSVRSEVERLTPTLEPSDRGLIYCSTVEQAEAISEALGICLYTAQMDTENPKRNQELKDANEKR